MGDRSDDPKPAIQALTQLQALLRNDPANASLLTEAVHVALESGLIDAAGNNVINVPLAVIVPAHAGQKLSL